MGLFTKAEPPSPTASEAKAVTSQGFAGWAKNPLDLHEDTDQLTHYERRARRPRVREASPVVDKGFKINQDVLDNAHPEDVRPSTTTPQPPEFEKPSLLRRTSSRISARIQRSFSWLKSAKPAAAADDLEQGTLMVMARRLSQAFDSLQPVKRIESDMSFADLAPAGTMETCKECKKDTTHALSQRVCKECRVRRQVGSKFSETL